MKTPRIFIGSSTGYLPAAHALKRHLTKDFFVEVWDESVFPLTYSTLDALLRKLDEYDFAVFVFAPDDPVLIKHRRTTITRDNVLFEFGLFMGRLGRDKCFFVKPSNVSMRVATDLVGITYADYSVPSGKLDAHSARKFFPAMSHAASAIGEHVKKAARGARQLIDEVTGDWIEIKARTSENRPYAFLTLKSGAGGVDVSGQSYALDGTPGVKFPTPSRGAINFAVVRDREILHAYSAEHDVAGGVAKAYGVSCFKFFPNDPCVKGDGYYASYSDSQALKSHRATFRLRKLTQDFVSCLLGKRRADTDQDRRSMIQQLEFFRSPKVCITGGPFSGKTEVIKNLAASGYSTLEESALLVINEQRLKLKRRFASWRNKNYAEFQTQIYHAQRRLEMVPRPGRHIMFMDRSAVDCIAYLELRRNEQRDLQIPRELYVYAEEIKFTKVFVLDTLPDYDERRDTGRESDYTQSLRIRDKLLDVYRRFGFDVHFLEVDTIPKRVQRIFENVKSALPNDRES